jgi:nitrogen fixation protein NifQ
MEEALLRVLQGRFGPDEAARIERRWRDNFGLAPGARAQAGARDAEYSDLLALLKEHAREDAEPWRALARWIAFSCIGENHFWEDLGLPDRRELTRLIADYFPRLRALNAGNMRWKRFFYRQLCERAQVFACRAPSCDRCSEYALCFAPPVAEAPRSSDRMPVPI